MGFPKISCLKNNQRDGGSREKVDCKTMSARRAEIKKSRIWKSIFPEKIRIWKSILCEKIHILFKLKIISLDSGFTYHPKTHFLSKLHALCALCELSRNSIVTSLPRVVCPIQRNNWECSCSYCTNDNSCLVNKGLREDINRKNTFSFGHYPNHLTRPPWPQFRQLGPFFGRQNSRFESHLWGGEGDILTT